MAIPMGKTKRKIVCINGLDRLQYLNKYSTPKNVERFASLTLLWVTQGSPLEFPGGPQGFERFGPLSYSSV